MATSKILTETKLIALNSKSGKILNKTKKSRCLFDFAKITDKSADILYMNVAVKSAEIPSSFYNITEHNNTLNVKLIPAPISIFLCADKVILSLRVLNVILSLFINI